jgi:hypothetical protein
MDFVASPVELWLAYRTPAGKVIAARIVGWDAANEPVPIAVFTGPDGSVDRIGPPNDDTYWISNTRQAATAAARPPQDERAEGLSGTTPPGAE